MPNKAKTTLSSILTIIVIFVLGCNLYTIVARGLFHVPYPTVFGFTNAVVLSGSMEDAISVNDLVIIHTQDSYQAGDVISFQSGDILVTHRVVEETQCGYITKGDANNAPDGEVLEEKVVGKVVMTIPGIGGLILALQSPLGMLLCTLGLTALFFVPYIFSKENESTEE